MWSESSFKNAGISRSSYRLIDQLSCKYPDETFTVFSNSRFQESPEWRLRKNLTVLPVVPSGRGRRAIWEFFGAGRKVAKGDFDIWFSTTHAVPFRSKVPSVAVIHDMIPMIFPQYGDPLQVNYLRIALIQVARRVTGIITNSLQTKQDIIRFARIEESKVSVVPFGSGMDPNVVFEMESGRAAPIMIPFRRFLLVIGTLEPRKNLGRLFEAMSLLREPEYAEVGLVIAGGRGWKEQGIFDKVEELELKDRIWFAGYLEDAQLAYLFAKCEAFIFPSIYEGFGMPIVEAMQRGAPVLTSGIGAMKEVAGDAARFFDPYSPQSIAGAIKQFLSTSETERFEQIQRGKTRAAQYTWELAAQETHQILRKLADSR